MRFLLTLSLPFFMLLLWGCAYVGDSNKVSVPHARGSNKAPLQVPPGMNMTFDSPYPLPQNPNHSAEPVTQMNISPPGIR